MPTSLSLFLERGQGLPHLSFTICSEIKAAFLSLLSAQDVFIPLLNHYAPAWTYLGGRMVTQDAEGTQSQAARSWGGAQDRYNHSKRRAAQEGRDEHPVPRGM